MLRPLQGIDACSEYHRSRYSLNARRWLWPVAARYGLVGTEFPDSPGGGMGCRVIADDEILLATPWLRAACS
ncbi:MAG TPA: hypothetical protein VIJ38_08530 [Acidobacteriaceae bacterium]